MTVRMHIHPVARVYAEALFEAVGAAGRTATAEALATLQRALEASPELRRFLEMPAMNVDVKKGALEGLRGRMDDLIVNFLGVLVENGRAELLGEIVAAYADLLDAAAHRTRAQVTTATPLAEDQRKRIQQYLAARLQREIVIEAAIDPAMIGGIVVRVGDRVLEGSVHGWLQRMRKELVRSSGYED
jgi:F-type H+-transporting ATPase subunit delta